MTASREIVHTSDGQSIYHAFVHPLRSTCSSLLLAAFIYCQSCLLYSSFYRILAYIQVNLFKLLPYGSGVASERNVTCRNMMRRVDCKDLRSKTTLDCGGHVETSAHSDGHSPSFFVCSHNWKSQLTTVVYALTDIVRHFSYAPTIRRVNSLQYCTR